MAYKMPSRTKWVVNSMLLCAALQTSMSCAKNTSVIGAVYPIHEENELEAIKREVEKVDWQAVLSKRTDSWLKNQMTELPFAQQDSIRFHKPIHVLEKQITDKDGVVIYPEGFEFNPLNHMRMPFRIVVISMEQLDWLKPKLTKMDRVLLTSGDVFEAREKLGHTVFLLDAKTQNKLNVLRIPSIIKQKGNLLEIEEFKFNPNDKELSNVQSK